MYFSTEEKEDQIQFIIIFALKYYYQSDHVYYAVNILCYGLEFAVQLSSLKSVFPCHGVPWQRMFTVDNVAANVSFR